MSEYRASGSGTFFASWIIKISSAMVLPLIVGSESWIRLEATMREVVVGLPNMEIIGELTNREVR